MAGHPPSSREPATPRPAELVNAFKWSFLGESASRLIAPAVFLILARLLSPEEFGVVAAAMVVTSLCQALADVGLGKALVQRQTNVKACANAAFWMTLAASVALGSALFTMHASIASFFGDQRIGPVVQVLAPLVPLTGLAAVPTALLQRKLAFRELFWVRLLTAGLPALASIPLALLGYGYWALVVGTLAGQLLQCAVLWWRSDWIPALSIEPSVARELVHFGRWTTLSALLAWGYGWLDALFVARYLGTHDMGLYRIGNTVVTMIFGLAFAPLLPVLFSAFSRTGDQVDRVAGNLAITVRAIALLSFPISALLYLFSTPIQTYLLGPAWAGLPPIIALLALGQGIAWIVGANGEAYRAVGRPDMEVATMASALLIYAGGYFLAARFGLIPFVATRAALVLIGLLLQVFVAYRVLGISVSSWMTACIKPIAFSGVCTSLVVLLRFVWNGGIVMEAAMILVFVSLYAALALAFDRSHVESLQRRLKRA